MSTDSKLEGNGFFIAMGYDISEISYACIPPYLADSGVYQWRNPYRFKRS